MESQKKTIKTSKKKAKREYHFSWNYVCDNLAAWHQASTRCRCVCITCVCVFQMVSIRCESSKIHTLTHLHTRPWYLVGRLVFALLLLLLVQWYWLDFGIADVCVTRTSSERERERRRKSICAVLCFNISCLAVYVLAVQPSIEEGNSLRRRTSERKRKEKFCCVVTRNSDQFPKKKHLVHVCTRRKDFLICDSRLSHSRSVCEHFQIVKKTTSIETVNFHRVFSSIVGSRATIVKVSVPKKCANHNLK